MTLHATCMFLFNWFTEAGPSDNNHFAELAQDSLDSGVGEAKQHNL